jgi:integrase
MSDKRITVWVQRFKDRPHLVLQWIDPETGRRKSKSAETADEKVAEDRRVDLEADLNAGRYAEASRMTWDGFRELFEEEYVATRRPKTRAIYRNVLNLFERVCNPGRLGSITERTLSAFAAGLRKLPGNGGGTMQPGTVRARLQFLRTALNWAARQRLITRCPDFPTVKVPKKRPQPVPLESFERLLAKAPDAHMRAYLLTGWLAGLRLAEALELEREANERFPYLDPGHDRIVIPAEFAKAEEDQWVPLDPELWKVLDELPRHGKKVFRFISRQTKGPLSESALSCRILALAKRAGVKLSMHSLRKGFGCRYAGKVPAQVLQKLMRHSNIAITMSYYANVDDAAMEAVLGKKEDRQPHPAGPGEQKAAERNSSRNSGPQEPEKTGGNAPLNG